MQLRHKPIEREKRLSPGKIDQEFYKSYNYEDSKHFKINHYPSERKPDYFRTIYNDLTELSPAIYSHNSRYKNIKRVKTMGKSYHVFNRFNGVKGSNEDLYHRVINGEVGRLDKIAQKYYGDASYWWIIAEANRMKDPLTETVLNRALRIPPFNSIIGYYI